MARDPLFAEPPPYRTLKQYEQQQYLGRCGDDQTRRQTRHLLTRMSPVYQINSCILIAEFFQDPKTYTTSSTSITPLGSVRSNPLTIAPIPNPLVVARVSVGSIASSTVLELVVASPHFRCKWYIVQPDAGTGSRGWRRRRQCDLRLCCSAVARALPCDFGLQHDTGRRGDGCRTAQRLSSELIPIVIECNN